MKRVYTPRNILVTGGCGFIGSNFIRYLFQDKTGFSGKIINLDKLTYAGNPLNLKDIQEKENGSRYFFEQEDICNLENNKFLLEKYQIDTIVNFAAESHVDRSIHGPDEFIKTNIFGTFNLLEACRNIWKESKDVLFHHVSTDEVFGSLGPEGYFTETTPYSPRSPYSASKAGSDHLVMAYHHTYGLPVTLSNCSNNYGPYQFPEKLIPLMILNMLEDRELPVYGDGKNIRDWLYVEDHNSAVWTVIRRGKRGESYNIGGENEWENIKLVNTLCEIVAKEVSEKPEKIKKRITFVKDRLGHDRRYAINCDKIKTELDWNQSITFEEGLKNTVRWYCNNSNWVNSIKSGNYRNWIKINYSKR